MVHESSEFTLIIGDEPFSQQEIQEKVDQAVRELRKGVCLDKEGSKMSKEDLEKNLGKGSCVLTALERARKEQEIMLLANWLVAKQIGYKHPNLEKHIKGWEERGVNQVAIEKIRRFQELERELDGDD